MGPKMLLRWKEWSMKGGEVLSRRGQLRRSSNRKSVCARARSGWIRNSSDDDIQPELAQGGQSGAHREVPAAVQKMYGSFTGAPQPITQSRTRIGRDAASLQATMRGGCQPFATRTGHAPRSTGVPGMAKLAARAKKAKWTGNSRARLA